jgi:hypothetical protein
LQPLEITDHVIDTHGNDILIVEVQPLPPEKPDEVILPDIPSDKSFYVVLQVIGKGSHHEKMYHRTCQVARNLNVDAKPEKPVAIEENTNNEDTQCLEEVKRVPKNIRMGSL